MLTARLSQMSSWPARVISYDGDAGGGRWLRHHLPELKVRVVNIVDR